MRLIEFRTLGTLNLRGEAGRELHSLLAHSKRMALLAYLCIAQPRGFHRRDTLLGLFWPNSDQEHARTSLRKSLHILRRALGEDAILSRGDEDVAVDFERVSCDVIEFEECLRAERLEEALQLYRGNLLAGFFIDEAPEFEQWLHAERARLCVSAARAALALSGQLEASGNVAAAVTWGRRSLELYDTDERALQKLIELQGRAGDRAGAIQTYEAFARHLAEDYETEPSADTRALIERIRSGMEPLGRETEAKAAANRERSSETTAEPTPHIASPGQIKVKPGRPRVRAIWYAVTALAALIFGAAIWSWVSVAPSKQVLRYALVVDSTEALGPGTPWSGRLAISPDGSRLAYVGGPHAQLWIRPRNQLHAFAIPGTEGVSTPFFSPDGSRVGFLRERSVEIAPLTGGRPFTVTDSLTGVAGASWGSDGFIYVDGASYSSLVRVEAKPGAVPVWFTTLDSASGEIDHAWPDVLPNGKGVLFVDAFRGKSGARGGLKLAIAVAEIPSGKHRIIVNDAMYPRYAASGHLLYVTTNRTLMAVPFDQNSMKVTGDPVELSEDVKLGGYGAADLGLSRAGTLVYSTGGGEGKRELVWVTREGRAESVEPDWQGFFSEPRLSPDGKRLAAVMEPVHGLADIWIKQLDRGTRFKLTLQGKSYYYLAWTQDGKSVSFTSGTRAGSLEVLTKRADGSAQEVLHLRSNWNPYGLRWSPDGRWLIFESGRDEPGAGDILGIRPGIDTAPVPLLASRHTEISPAFSPDGHWLAYVSNENGHFDVYVVPFPNTRSAKWVVSTSGGTEAIWAHSGRELFYRDASGNLVAVEVRTKPTFSLGRSTVLFPAGEFGSSFDLLSPQYDVTPDAQRFLMIRPVATRPPDKLIVVENWFEELNAKSRR